MPYIKQKIRDELDPAINNLLSEMSGRLGESRSGILNYVVSRIVPETSHPRTDLEDWSYVEITEVVAAFECAKLEFYRRVAGPKEDAAIDANGDIRPYGWIGPSCRKIRRKNELSND